MPLRYRPYENRILTSRSHTTLRTAPQPVLISSWVGPGSTGVAVARVSVATTAGDVHRETIASALWISRRKAHGHDRNSDFRTL